MPPCLWCGCHDINSMYPNVVTAPAPIHLRLQHYNTTDTNMLLTLLSTSLVTLYLHKLVLAYQHTNVHKPSCWHCPVFLLLPVNNSIIQNFCIWGSHMWGISLCKGCTNPCTNPWDLILLLSYWGSGHGNHIYVCARTHTHLKYTHKLYIQT